MINVIETLASRWGKPGILELELGNVRKAKKASMNRHDLYLISAELYLEWAIKHGLEGQAVAASCYDLALLSDKDLAYAMNQDKITLWHRLRQQNLDILRAPRRIPMQLYPIYFAAIFGQSKTYEGRAFDPYSPKNYPDIREGDTIEFSVSRETHDWAAQCREFGLNPAMMMESTVEAVEFAPTVHWMFSTYPYMGEEFQPMVRGPAEIFNLQRAAVYYTFPEYRQRISDFGFLGFKLTDVKAL